MGQEGFYGGKIRSTSFYLHITKTTRMCAFILQKAVDTHKKPKTLPWVNYSTYLECLVAQTRLWARRESWVLTKASTGGEAWDLTTWFINANPPWPGWREGGRGLGDTGGEWLCDTASQMLPYRGVPTGLGPRVRWVKTDLRHGI